MAEHGAHLTSRSSATTVADGHPSVFEVLAQESLSSSIRSAVKYVFRVVAEKNPHRYGFLYRYTDELYALLDLILQHHYLTIYSASFGENFYGLKRVDGGAHAKAVVETGSTGHRLADKTIKKSLFFLVVLPYLRHKLDHVYEDMVNIPTTQQFSAKSLKATLTRAFMAVYPFLHTVIEGVTFIFQLRYVLKKSQFYSPWLMLAGVHLQSLTDDDLKLHVGQQINWKGSEAHNSWSVFHWLISRLVGEMLSNGLSVGVFFLQFLEWWYSSPGSPGESFKSLPVPEPPQIMKTDDCGSTTTFSNTCPLCRRRRTNETALSVSGYIFCYPCIYHHLQQHSSCPVTGYPARTDHLIRIYSHDSSP